MRSAIGRHVFTSCARPVIVAKANRIVMIFFLFIFVSFLLLTLMCFSKSPHVLLKIRRNIPSLLGFDDKHAVFALFAKFIRSTCTFIHLHVANLFVYCKLYEILNFRSLSIDDDKQT